MKIGDYVRTKEFGINRVDWFDNKEPIMENGYTALQDNYKTSPNIIDLIEVGDYVNGCEVLEICNYGNCDSHLIVNGNGFNVIMLEDIKSIVTREQFEEMEYKL